MVYDTKKWYYKLAEQCVVLFLNNGSKILGSYQLSSGGLTGTIMDVRLILAIALKSLASGIILSHNHPSGSLKPSRCDIALTIKIQEAARIMDIKVLDHIILTPEHEYFSFADEGLL